MAVALQAHVLAPMLDTLSPVRFPFLVLLASGGHTLLATVTDVGSCALIGSTLDDSLGEAFDKVGRMIHATEHVGPGVYSKSTRVVDVLISSACVCVCVCDCARVSACVCVTARARVRACVCVRACVRVYGA